MCEAEIWRQASFLSDMGVHSQPKGADAHHLLWEREESLA